MVHELQGRTDEADVLVALADEDRDNPTMRKAPWLARIAAHRGEPERALGLLDERHGDGLLWHGVLLEARCDVVADVGAWDRADEAVADAVSWAAEDRLVALPLHAERLRGRTAAARGDLDVAAASLARAKEGFGALGAVWDEALASLALAEALAADPGRGAQARAAAAEALRTFDRLGSKREADRARTLIES